MKARGNYNWFKMKRNAYKTMPKIAKTIFGEGARSLTGTVVGGTLSRVAPFSIGQTIAEEFGASKGAQAVAGAATARVSSCS